MNRSSKKLNDTLDYKEEQLQISDFTSASRLKRAIRDKALSYITSGWELVQLDSQGSFIRLRFKRNESGLSGTTPLLGALCAPCT